MRRLAIDSNLLMLFIVGSVAPEFISKHRRLRAYDRDDFVVLQRALNDADTIITTPNVATEVSNLVGYGVSEPLLTRLNSFLRFWIPNLLEHYEKSGVAVKQPEFLRLGIADCAWFGALDAETILLTDDLSLYLATVSRGFAAKNFSNLRRESNSA